MAQTDVQFRRLNTCTFDDAVQLWNDGFSGYYSDMTRQLHDYVAQLGSGGIHPQFSVAAYVGGRPAGFVLIAVKNVDGKKLAWNGGTGVHPEFRRQGIAKAMMKEAVGILREQGVNTAILEAVSINHGAIAAYRSAGFETVDHLAGLSRDGAFTQLPFVRSETAEAYRVVRGTPAAVSRLPFYRDQAAWGSQWFNIRDGESAVLYDSRGQAVAYTLSKRSYTGGTPSSIVLYQCEVAPGRNDACDIVNTALAAVYSPFDLPCKRITDNLSMSNDTVIRALKEAGFGTVYEQVLMFANL